MIWAVGILIPLLGRLKGETGDRYHLLPMSRRTDSGFDTGTWADRLGEAMISMGFTNGFLFGDGPGTQVKIGTYDAELHSRLAVVKISNPKLFESGINIEEKYGLRRSLRRGSNTEAANRGVPRDVIELNNRWRKFESSKRRHQQQTMRDHYSDILLSIPTFIRFSQAL